MSSSNSTIVLEKTTVVPRRCYAYEWPLDTALAIRPYPGYDDRSRIVLAHSVSHALETDENVIECGLKLVGCVVGFTVEEFDRLLGSGLFRRCDECGFDSHVMPGSSVCVECKERDPRIVERKNFLGFERYYAYWVPSSKIATKGYLSFDDVSEEIFANYLRSDRISEEEVAARGWKFAGVVTHFSKEELHHSRELELLKRCPECGYSEHVWPFFEVCAKCAIHRSEDSIKDPPAPDSYNDEFPTFRRYYAYSTSSSTLKWLVGTKPPLPLVSFEDRSKSISFDMYSSDKKSTKEMVDGGLKFLGEVIDFTEEQYAELLREKNVGQCYVCGLIGRCLNGVGYCTNCSSKTLHFHAKKASLTK